MHAMVVLRRDKINWRMPIFAAVAPFDGLLVAQKSDRVIRPGRFKLNPPLARLSPQLAFFSNTGLPTFFSIARLRSSARGERTSALALIR